MRVDELLQQALGIAIWIILGAAAVIVVSSVLDWAIRSLV